jgi:hypothetical protein
LIPVGADGDGDDSPFPIPVSLLTRLQTLEFRSARRLKPAQRGPLQPTQYINQRNSNLIHSTGLPFPNLPAVPLRPHSPQPPGARALAIYSSSYRRNRPRGCFCCHRPHPLLCCALIPSPVSLMHTRVSRSRIESMRASSTSRFTNREEQVGPKGDSECVDAKCALNANHTASRKA